MTKKTTKRKKQDIIIKSLQNCFQEFDVPLEVVRESKEIILLCSPILVGLMKFHVTVALMTKMKIVNIIITNPERIATLNVYQLIKFANKLNKMYSTIGYLTVDTRNRYISSHFAVELIDERLDTNHLKICFNSVLGQVAHFFGFVERENIENSTSEDLITQFIEFSNKPQKFENNTYH